MARTKFKVGDKVKWNDPGIEECEPEDREYVLNRIFEITDVSEEVICITDGCTEAEVLPSELKKVK